MMTAWKRSARQRLPLPWRKPRCVQADLDLGYTEICAPVTGRISRHEVSAGNLITGGYSGDVTLLTTIVSLDPIYFDFDVSEANYLAYQRATERGAMQSMRDNKIEVFAKLPDEDQWAHQGSLEFLDNQVNETSGTIRARATFANSNGAFTPGQFAHIRVPGSELYEAILLPETAIVTDQSQKIALVVAEDGTVGSRSCALGRTTTACASSAKACRLTTRWSSTACCAPGPDRR